MKKRVSGVPQQTGVYGRAETLKWNVQVTGFNSSHRGEDRATYLIRYLEQNPVCACCAASLSLFECGL